MIERNYGSLSAKETPGFGSRLASWDTGYLQGMVPGAKHLVIATDDDVVEIVSSEEPEWEEIEAADADSPAPGKVTHLYFGEDDDKIAELVAEFKRRQPK
jgi:hypothetical protein